MSGESIQTKVVHLRSNTKRRARKIPEKDRELDIFVGNQIKKRRKQLKMSQIRLGKALDVTFQQIQKYETAGNRVSASTLLSIAEFLDVPLTYFFPNQIARQEDGTKKIQARLKAAVEAIDAIKAENKQQIILLEEVKNCLLSLFIIEN